MIMATTNLKLFTFLCVFMTWQSSIFGVNHKEGRHTARNLADLKKVVLDEDSLSKFPVQRNGFVGEIDIIEEIDNVNDTDVFKKLGIELLGMEYMDLVNDIVKKEREIAVYHLLILWLHRKGSEEVTCRKLVTVLQKKRISLNYLAEMISHTCGEFDILDIPCKPRLFKQYATELFNKYKRDIVTVIENHLWLQSRLPKQIQFVDLEYRENGRDFSVSLDEFFTDTKSNSRMLFTGRPGSGKSTLTRQVSKMMVSTNLFDLVVRVELGIHHKLHSLVDLLEAITVTPYDSYQFSVIAKYIELTQGKGVLFLLDGYDEYTESQVSSDYISALIDNTALIESAVLLTSRPKAVEDMRYRFDRHIEIIGFGDEGVNRFLMQFNMSEAQNETVYQYFAIHPNIRQLCSLPLHLSMLAYIATEPVDTGTLSLVHSETLLYSSFLSLTIKQYEMVRHKKTARSLTDCYKDMSAKTDLCILFRQISKVSFKKMIEKSQTFTSADLDRLPVSINVSAELEALSLFKIDKVYDMRGIDLEKYSYSHPTFQEFFGAFYLANNIMFSGTQTDFMKYYWTHEMYKFSLGLMRDVLEYDSHIVTRAFINYGRVILATYQNQQLHVMKCAHEISEGQEFVTNLKEVGIVAETNSLQVETYSSLECWYIGYLLSKSYILDLGLTKFSELEECVSFVTEYLRHDSISANHVNVTKLVLGDYSTDYWAWFTRAETEITINKLLKIVLLLKNDLKHLELRYVTFESGESIIGLGKILNSFRKLKYLALSISVSVITDGHLESAVKDLSQLEHLELGVVCEYDEDTVIPDSMLEFRNLQHIQSLTLHSSWNKVDVNLTALFGGLRYMSSLKRLSISLILYGGFRENGAVELYKGLQELHSVNELELRLDLCWDIGLGNVSTEDMSLLLKELSVQLRKLTLCIDYNFSGIIGPSGVVQLADGLKKLINVHSLSLELRWELQVDDNINEATAALANSLKELHNITTMELNLKHNGRLNELTRLFGSLTQLQELRIGWTSPGGSIGQTDVAELLAGLDSLQQLTKLDLSWNTISDQEMPSLSQSLKSMHHLRTLDLSHNQIGNGVILLADVIELYLTDLEVLILNDNNFTDVGAKYLADKVSSLPKLYKLEFDLKLGNYSAQVLAQKSNIFKNKISVAHRWTIFYGHNLMLFISTLVGLGSVLMCWYTNYVKWLTTSISLFVRRTIIILFEQLFRRLHVYKRVLNTCKTPNFSMALSQGIFSTSKAWKLGRLDKYGLTGSGTVIAILDTAVDSACSVHVLDYINILPNISLTSTLHGSICASIAAGSPKPQDGIPRGVAPDAHVLVYRIADNNVDNEPCCTNESVLEALEDIILKMSRGTLKVDVVSISYDLDEDERMKRVSEKITTLANMGVTFVAAAGNLGRYMREAAIPARFENVISVGSLDKHGDPSTFNPDVEIDVRAPGELYLPALANEVTGSSLAAPAIGGIVLLLKQLANRIGPPASEKIHYPHVLRAIFKDMTTQSHSGKSIFDPVGFLLDLLQSPSRLHEIVEQEPEEPMSL